MFFQNNTFLFLTLWTTTWSKSPLTVLQHVVLFVISRDMSVQFLYVWVGCETTVFTAVTSAIECMCVWVGVYALACVCVCGLWRYTISPRLSVGCQSSPPHSWHINNSEMMQTRWGLTPSPGYKRSSSSTLIKIPSTYWHGKGEKCGRDLLQCCLD